MVDRAHAGGPWHAVIAFPVMKVGVRTQGDTIGTIHYLPPSMPELAPRNALAERAARELEHYRDDPDAPLDLPIAPSGTPFQMRVWEALRRIPRGSVKTYGTVAKEIEGAAREFGAAAARAVGQACGENRLPLVIPCHRVVAANGLGGFAHSRGGYRLEAKQWLLVHERAI